MLADYQRRLAAQDTYGVLMCLQALDAGGKDGTIRHVMSGVNPQGVHVSNFKVPSAQRFLKRIDVPERNWKFSPADVRERAYWDEYQRAFSEMLSATSTRWAPWYVIPADRKWFARLCAAAVLVHTLIAIDPQYPEVSDATRHELGKTKRELESEAPKGVPADPYQAAAAAGNGFRSAAQRR
jgi:polyphosphate kinase 2 (PPK2 family)